MRRLLGLVFAALAATMLLALNAGQALAGEVHCGDTITQDTKLDSNLLNCPGDGLVVGAPNVTIDLNGHRIWGSGTGDGIANVRRPPQVNCSHDSCSSTAGFPGLTLKNGTIGGFAVDVYAVGDHQTFRSLHVRGTLAGCCFGQYDRLFPSDTQVLATRVDGSIRLGSDSAVRGSQAGGTVSLMGGTVSRNVIGGAVGQGQMYGTHYGAGPVLIFRNSIGNGVGLPASPGAQVDQNTISGGIHALHIDSPPTPLSISGNTIRASVDDGIHVTGDFRTNITGNRVYGNPGNGVWLSSSCTSCSSGCTDVTANRIHGNGLNGIYVTGRCTAPRTFKDNSIWGNSADGLYVGNNHAPILISGNSARLNGGDGIHVGPSTGEQASFFWSADGQKVAFADNHGLSWDIYSANSDGTGVTRLMNDPGQDTKPQFSPDGSMIAFISDRAGSHNLYVMRPDGSGVRKLASFEVVQDPDEPIPVRERTLVWSLDSKRVLFGNDMLYSVNADGTDLHTVGEARLVVNPRWTPNGTRIVFEAGPWYPTLALTTYIVNADGTGLRYADPATDYPNGTVIGGVNPTGQTISPDVLINPFVTLTGNAANENKGLGIDAVPDVVDGGGNRAWRNGSSAQCVAGSLCGGS